jgi:hypothetical protein
MREAGMRRLAMLLAAAMMLIAGPAAAGQQALWAQARWHAMDICTKQAQAAFPDFTAEAAAKRDAQMNQCLELNNLPPRQPELPAAPH